MNGREQVRLTRRFILEAAHIAADDSGGFVTRWCALGTLWAAMRGQSGREVTGQAGPRRRCVYKSSYGLRPIMRPIVQSPVRDFGMPTAVFILMR